MISSSSSSGHGLSLKRTFSDSMLSRYTLSESERERAKIALNIAFPTATEETMYQLLANQLTEDDPRTYESVDVLEEDLAPEAFVQESVLETSPPSDSNIWSVLQLETHPDRPHCLLNTIAVQSLGQPVCDMPCYDRDALYELCTRSLGRLQQVEHIKPESLKDSLTVIIKSYQPACCRELSELGHILTQTASRPATQICEIASWLSPLLSRPAEEFNFFGTILDQVLDTLHRSPYRSLGTTDYDLLIQKAKSLITTFDKACKNLREMESLPAYLREAITTDQSSLKTQLEEHCSMLEVLQTNDFRGISCALNSVVLSHSTANQLLSTKSKNRKARASLQVINEAHDKVNLQLSAANSIFWPDMIARLLGFESLILEKLHDAGLDSEYEETLIQQIQETQCQPFTKTIMYRFAGKYHPLVLKYEPAGALRVEPPAHIPASPQSLSPPGAKPRNNCDPFEIQYNNRLSPSMKRDEAEHCVNMMLASMKLGPLVIYDEIRVGIPYAFAVDRQKRKTVTALRWREILTAALIQKYPAELARAMAMPHSHPPVKLTIFYNCLLSPDSVRSKMPIDDKEQKWVLKTREYIKQLNSGPPITLSITDRKGGVHPVTVQPRIFMVVCPCNELAFDSVIPSLGTWHCADDVTQDTLLELFGSLDPIEAYTGYTNQVASRLSADSAERQEIEELVQLIRFLFSNQLHRKLLPEPMYFSNLITELGRMLGAVNVIGCKSAKDRTGNKSQSDMKMAADCYFARLQYQQNPTCLIVPLPFRYLTETDHFHCCQFSLNSGQEENQLMSTAIPGYKVRKYMMGCAVTVFPVLNRRVKPIKNWW
ncbi:inositol phosphate phosphatase SopB [Spongorhabdus nitratireducens]